MIRVAIVSPNHALRIGLRELLSRRPDIKVVGETIDLESVTEMETEVLVLASVSPAQITNELAAWPAILLLTDDRAQARALISSGVGVWGLLPPDATQDELVSAVRALGEGLWVGAPGLMRGLIRAPNRVELTDGESPAEPLTARETEVLQRIAQGLANKQIAVSLGISEHTVKFHLSSLYAKLNVSSRTEAVKVGLSLGLISL